jgi:alpha-tubulin suppressor-like RCC1 family protein
MLSQTYLFLALVCLISARLLAATPAISAGHSHSLFLKADGNVWGAGDNSEGQLGAGSGGWNTYGR